MDRRFDTRLKEMLAQAEVSPELIEGLLSRLETFAQPFTSSLRGSEQHRHTVEYVTGLLSKLERKTGEGIAYLHDQERQGIQKFIGFVPWDHKPLLDTLATQVGMELGEPDDVIVFDPSAFAKKGTMSVGVARQWCGRLGKLENCQVGVYMAYVSSKEHAITNAHLYLPEEWTKDRARCKAAGVPKGTKFRTRHELALEMLDEHGSLLPHSWITDDDEMGRPMDFRLKLRGRGERYLLAIPSNTLVRDIDAPAPEYAGRGKYPMNPFTRVDRWCSVQPESAWTTIEVRDGEKGPLTFDVVKCRVQARTPTGGTGLKEVLFITRECLSNGKYKHDYYLSNGESEVSLKEYARVAKAEHRVEDCLRRAKSEAGLGDYQVRGWSAWHHHQTLSLLAAWFLTQETRRGKNTDPGNDLTADETFDCGRDRVALRSESPVSSKSSHRALVGAKRVSSVVPSSCS
jgi:SRSO17 transposase